MYLQDFIHKLEVGGGMRYIRITLAVLALLMLTVGYNWRSFRNMATQEAMDSAQVGRNIAEGKGFSTLFIRPFSLYLIKRHNLDQQGPGEVGKSGDMVSLKGNHPDLANPPVYPFFLAGLMKVLPFDYAVHTSRPFWSNDGRFWRYQPDFFIALANQLLFYGILALTFLFARRLFDSSVAWLSTLLVLGTEMMWRFSVSGLSTMLLLLILMGVVWFLVLLEQEAREPKRGPGALFGFAALAGLLVGIGMLTRYSFGAMIVPVLLFVILFGGQKRVALSLVAAALFAGAIAPWIVRNYSVSGTPFGTAGYAILENTFIFPDFRLARSLEPDLTRPILVAFWNKLMTNAHTIIQDDLPRLGGSWIAAFFLVGLLIPFQKPSTQRLRYFLLSSILVLTIAQSLSRTHLSDASPEINSENLLFLLTPLVMVYGVSLFFVLLDQLVLPVFELRYVIMAVFGAVACLPMIFSFLPPKTVPVAYPPYFPPAIQTVAGWMKPTELTMSDIPWAMAWYGQRQSVWLTLRATPDPKDPTLHEDFFAINDFCKPIQALYLTPETMDSRFLTQWIQAGEQSWGSFILQSMVQKEVPTGFPLRKSQAGWLPNQLVLTDFERWRK